MYYRPVAKTAKRLLRKAQDRMQRGSEEFSALTIGYFVPALWVSFLDAAPQDGESMWPIYSEFARFIGAIRKVYRCSGDIRGMKLLSKEEFLERYPLELQEDAKRLHAGMKKVVDEERWNLLDVGARDMDEEERARKRKGLPPRAEEAEAVITGGAAIPPMYFSLGNELAEVNGKSSLMLQLHTPNANHRNFWLAVIYEGMLDSNYNKQVRRCEAPDCQKYFIPAPHSHGQRYHNKSCRSRHNMQKRRNQPLP